MPDVPNAVVNNVLCFVGSARHSYADKNTVSICEAFYSYEEIFTAKEILFSLCSEHCTRRRGDNRVSADLNDMLSQLRKADENSLDLPKFLCDSHSKMPPSSGFEVLSEHLVKLISELGNLKAEVSELKKLKMQNDLNAVKNELRSDCTERKK